MSAHSPKRGGAAGDRRACGGCEATLARDNMGHLCNRCLRDQRDLLRTPPAHLPAVFWETDDFRAAFQSRHIGKVLKAYRNHPRHRQIFGKALNQGTLGRWLGLEQSQVSKIENSPKPEPNTEVVELYAETLHIPRHLLWIVPKGHTLSTYQSQLRTSFGEGLPASRIQAQITVASDFSDTLDSVADGDPEAHIRQLTSAREHFERMYRTSGGVPAGSRIELYLTRRVLPMTAGLGDGVRIDRRSRRAIGGLVAFAGVCAYDSEDWSTANSHFRHALKIAESSEDHELHAYVIALMVNQALALEDFQAAESFANAGLRSLNGGSNTPLAIDLNMMRAKALASMGDKSAAQHLVNDLEAALDKLPASNSLAEARYAQEAHLQTQLTDALTTIGDLKAARRYGELSLMTDWHARGRVNRLASLATVEVARGDMEHAALLAREMADSIQGMESRRLRSRFLRLRAELAARPAASTRDAIDRMDLVIMLMS